MDIEITFINNSDDMNNSNVVIFQKNMAADIDSKVVAWKVIKNCGRNWSHKIIYPTQFEVAVADSHGNNSNLHTATNSQKWAVILSPSGNVLKLQPESAANPDEVEIANNLETGAINAQIYKSGSLLAIKTGISPEEKGTFKFQPEIYVGVISQIEEGQEINPAIIEGFTQKFSLFDITKANLIMTGGGIDPEATPLVFELAPTS